MERRDSTGSETLLDCIVIGAGPGGLQACIHLGRYNFRVMLFNIPGGRTSYAKHLENYLDIPLISGPELLETGLGQAKNFGVTIENARVERVTGREGTFEVQASGRPTAPASSSPPQGPRRPSPRSRTFIVSSGTPTTPA
jgi:thioredoxin reductase (NADPH)